MSIYICIYIYIIYLYIIYLYIRPPGYFGSFGFRQVDHDTPTDLDANPAVMTTEKGGPLDGISDFCNLG